MAEQGRLGSAHSNLHNTKDRQNLTINQRKKASYLQNIFSRSLHSNNRGQKIMK